MSGNNQTRSDEIELLASVNEDSVVKLLQDVLQIESTNPPGNEIHLARYLADFFNDVGLNPVLLEYEDNHANLVVRIKGSADQAGLIFSAHMDTVPAGKVPWKFPPFSGAIHEGRIYGRGAADMKSGLAAMAEAAAILARTSTTLRGDLIVAFAYDETHGLEGSKRLVDGGYLNDASAVLISEPSTLDVFIAEKGALWLNCKARGKTAHTSMPHLGRNAIFEMVRFLQRLDSELDLGKPNHPLLGNPTYTVGTIQGGVTINVLPDLCEAQVDIRLVPGQDYSEIIEKVRQIAGENVSVEVIDWKPPVETNPDADIVKLAVDAVEQITGGRRRPKGVSYYTDGAILANRLSIPMVNIGPADTGMTHQPNENVEVSRLVQAVKIYLLIATRYLS
jgi:succinyl-diaminopimelate desuccinylase